MPTTWIEIKAKGPRDTAEGAADILINAGSPGLLEEVRKLSSLEAHSVWEYDRFEETSPEATASYTAYLPAGSAGKVEQLRLDLKKLGWSFTVSTYKNQDWSIKWRSRIRPVRVTYQGTSVVIKPTWREIKRRRGDIVVELDPGMAFGTGSHATTKMCLRAILTLLKTHKNLSSLLDVGTGSGILAIAAKKLKVKKAAGIDIDKVALKVARQNARLNRAAITISASPLEKVKGAYSIVVANILAGDLLRLSGGLFKKTSPGGFLILSGILREEAVRVEEGFKALGFKPHKTCATGEWAALVLRRPS